MSTVQLRNIHPVGQIDLPVAGRQGEPFGQEEAGCLEPGEVFEVDADVAGRAPSWVPFDAEAVYGPGTEFRTSDAGAIEVHDLGDGLLAQVGNFELASAPASTPPPPPAPAGNPAGTDPNGSAQ